VARDGENVQRRARRASRQSVEDRCVALPLDLLEESWRSRLLKGDAQDEFAVARDGFAAVGEEDFEAEESGISGEGVDLVGVRETGEGFVPVGVVKRIAVLGGDGMSAEESAENAGGVGGIAVGILTAASGEIHGLVEIAVPERSPMTT
jgi:hypothetical protein